MTDLGWGTDQAPAPSPDDIKSEVKLNKVRRAMNSNGFYNLYSLRIYLHVLGTVPYRPKLIHVLANTSEGSWFL